jgi:HSP20 family protein
MVIDFSSLYAGPSELERFFEDMLRKSPFHTRHLAYPQVNIAENDDGYIVDVCMPGVPPEEVELELTARNLIIRAERKAPEGRYFRQERSSGVFQRALSLNAPVDRDKVAAKSNNGILRVTLPKAEAVKPRKINIIS